MGEHKITLSFLIDDSSAEYSIESEDEAIEELNKALGELPPTVSVVEDSEKRAGHEITEHRTKVEKTTVRPDPSSSSFLTEVGESETVDYSSDSGGKWYSCSCGEEFQTEGEAYDHVTSNQERYVVLRTEASDADGLDFRAEDFPFRATDKEHAVKKYIDEQVDDLDTEEIEEASCMEEQHYFAVKWKDLKAFGHSEEVPVHGVLGK